MVVYEQDVVQQLVRDFHGLAQSLFQGAAVTDRRFRSFFGASLLVAAQAFYIMYYVVDSGPWGTVQQTRFLWALMILKKYETEENLAVIAGVDEKTFRKWGWRMVEDLSYLETEVILFENRYKNDVGNDCLMSVDGVDFLFMSNKLLDGGPDRSYFSHKFRNSAVRYEVGMSILSSDICWIAGPYKAGNWPDISIFRSGLKQQLDDGERVECDNGYIGDSPLYCKCPGAPGGADRKFMQQRVRNRHETVNARFKIYRCLTTKFRHGIEKHGWCVHAIAVLTQLAIENGEELFDVREYEDGVTDAEVTDRYGF